MGSMKNRAVPSAATSSSVPAGNRFPVLRVLKRLLMLAAIAVLLLGGWLGWKMYRSIADITGDNNPLQLLGIAAPSALVQTNGRTNILLAGYSVGDPGHAGAALTDTIMVVSMDRAAKSAVMISIPRDLWVDIPNFGHQKINAAYEDGQSERFSQPGYPNGGMGLLEEVIQQNLGIQTNYYALVDYAALVDTVNDVGGIDVTIDSSDPRGIYDSSIDYATGGPLADLSNGRHHLDGQQALDLARARGDGAGSYGFPSADFTRTSYQQQILVALKNKAGSTGVIANPLKAGALISAIGKNVKTDMAPGTMLSAYSESKATSAANIRHVFLNDVGGRNLLADYDTPSGETALIPAQGIDGFSAVREAIARALAEPSSSPGG